MLSNLKKKVIPQKQEQMSHIPIWSGLRREPPVINSEQIYAQKWYTFSRLK